MLSLGLLISRSCIHYEPCEIGAKALSVQFF